MNLHLWSPGFTGFGGGIGAFSQELALGLRELGHQLRLGGLLDASGTWRGFRIFGAGGRPAWLRRPLFALQCALHCRRDDPREIVSTHVNFGPLAMALRQYRRPGVTLVAHGVDVHPGLSRLRLHALRHADRLLAVSHWTRQRLLGLGGIRGERVVVLPNTFDAARFCVGPRPEGLARRLGIGAGEKVVLTVARLDPRDGYKGYDRIVEGLPEVVRACGPLRFVVVGQGDDARRIRELARARGVGPNVVLTGFVSDEELPDYYRLADAFALASAGEGFGIVFLEAMGCGTPVLAGNRDGSVDALQGGRLGALVDPLEVKAIAAGLIRLLQRQGPAEWFDRQRLSAAAVRQFGREAFLARLQSIFG